MSQTTKRDWILTIPAIDAMPSNELTAECQNAEIILQNSLAKSGQPCYVKQYGSVPWDGSNGSIPHMIEMSDDMAHLAYDLHMDIKSSKHKINCIYIIAPHNAAVFVIKFLALFTQLEYRLDNWTQKEFNVQWNLFPVSKLGDRYPVRSIFRWHHYQKLKSYVFLGAWKIQVAKMLILTLIRLHNVLPLEDMDKVLSSLFSRNDDSGIPEGKP